MKSTIGIAIFAIVLIFESSAQVKIDIQSGLNVANLSNPGNLIPTAVWNTRLGFIGSVTTDFEVNQEFSIHSGLRYAQKGTKSEFFWPSEGMIRGTLTLTYLEIPIYFKYNVIDFGTKLFVLGGPTVSILLNTNQVGTSDLRGEIVINSEDQIKYKPYDASIDIGTSTLTPLNSTFSFIASAVYSYGVVNISDSYLDGSGRRLATNTTEKTRDFRVLFGVSYLIQ